MVSASIDPPDEVAAFAPEHRLRFRVFAKQAAIDQRRQILATQRGQLKTVLDRIS
jgi:hypothetical protein